MENGKKQFTQYVKQIKHGGRTILYLLVNVKKFLHSSYMLQSFYKTIHKQDQLSNNLTMNIDRCKDSQKRLNGYQITHDHDQSTATLGHNSVSDHNFGIILNIL